MALENFPLIYVIALLALLSATGIFVLRQVLKTRKLESALGRLQRKLRQETGTALDYYELGSIQLDKRLYAQAIINLNRAIKTEELDGDALAAVYNALGFAYFAQEQFDLAMKQYKEALKLSPEYVTAINNLGHSYERKQLANKALEMYDQALALEPKNGTAKRRAEALRKRIATPSPAK
ncbi:tetratricopeptide repeat protein [filamentous cyanobacterium LEGE 11480]|uniref:Tetratricopeptide repeat protein n=1 Tax=Romeriopsis navalis LEGE 11480 TaxID=2777977 RepID=A0A928VWD3_9CYAN|nr:tetratricopeptide repeat protein [Romeriopsis navalis]MBE9033249.1 tetratricopeptide repeat protein [Romeriopsis navalis LEGE 11480]